jgi:GNAT superfamily N-acetyltransferase
MTEIAEFIKSDLEEVQILIHLTIKKCYPEIYPPEIVEFFINYHSTSEILRRAKTGKLLVIKDNSLIIATGFLTGSELGGVYVHPDQQGRGYGSLIVKSLLKVAAENKIALVHLDSTPIAKPMYEKLGFQLIRPAVQMVGNVPLDFFIMEKNIL